MRKNPTGERKWCKEARELWKKENEKFDFTASELAKFRVGLSALTRLKNAETLLDEQGLIFTTASGQVKKNPLAEIVKNERQGFLSCMRELGLDDEQGNHEVGRPAGDKRQVAQVMKWQK